MAPRDPDPQSCASSRQVANRWTTSTLPRNLQDDKAQRLWGRTDVIESLDLWWYYYYDININVRVTAAVSAGFHVFPQTRRDVTILQLWNANTLRDCLQTTVQIPTLFLHSVNTQNISQPSDLAFSDVVSAVWPLRFPAADSEPPQQPNSHDQWLLSFTILESIKPGIFMVNYCTLCLYSLKKQTYCCFSSLPAYVCFIFRSETSATTVHLL